MTTTPGLSARRGPRSRDRVALATALIVLAAAPGQAQDQPRELCFRGRPADQCRMFWIVESHYYYLLSPSGSNPSAPYPTGTRHYLMAEAGLMGNVSPRLAVGGTAWGGYDWSWEEGRVGLLARGRRWLSPRNSVEMTLGPFTTGGGLGLAAGVALNGGDLAHVGLRVERVPLTYSCLDPFWTPPQCAQTAASQVTVGETHLYAGVGLGTKPALLAWIGAAVLGLIAAAAQGM